MIQSFAHPTDMTQTKVLFLMPVVSQVRYRKRIQALSALGVAPKILSFERDYFSGEPAEGYVSLGRLEHSNYLKRLRPFSKAFPIIKKHAEDARALYCFGLDMLMLGWLVNKRLGGRLKLIYEVGDIRTVLLGEGRKAQVLRRVESFLVRRIDRLVVTSEAYVKEYYEGILGLKGLNYQVVENKLEEGFVPTGKLTIPEPTAFTIGYFGLLRCKQSWTILKKFANTSLGKARVYVRGYPSLPKDLAEQAKHVENLEYGGPYVAPDELPTLYSAVDIVWACYPYEENRPVGNWRWARTNRFYEACYFGKPMITQKGTEDGRVVEDLDIGLNIDLSDTDSVIKAVKAITPEMLRRWQENLRSLPKEVFMYKDEHKELTEFLTDV